MRAYAELAVTTNFSFLRGASHPEEIVAQAAALGLSGIGIADHNFLRRRGARPCRPAGMARRIRAATVFADLHLAIGVRLVFADDTPDLLAYPRDRAALWAALPAPDAGQAPRPQGRLPHHP